MALDARQQTKNLLAAAPIRKQTLEDFISGTGIRTQHQASADTRATAEILAGDEYGGLHLCRVSLRRPRRQLCEKRSRFTAPRCWLEVTTRQLRVRGAACA